MKIRNPINNCRPGAARVRPTPARCSSPSRSIPTNYRADRRIHSEGARGFAYGYQTETTGFFGVLSPFEFEFEHDLSDVGRDGHRDGALGELGVLTHLHVDKFVVTTLPRYT